MVWPNKYLRNEGMNCAKIWRSGEQGLKEASQNEKYWGWVKPEVFSLPPFLPSPSLPSFTL